MGWNRTNFNNNVMGDSGRRCRHNDNVAGESGNRRRCLCECRFVNDRVASEIALRGPGCISGTGRCGRDTAEFVEQDFGFNEGFCGQVSQSGNVQTTGRRKRCDCRCFNKCLRDLLEDLLDEGCPR
ncbi:MAG: hypothetical protein PHE29_05410 [Tissierellia bacterium]|nr:hypothetical protein [Tissierellia bacterium]MDD4780803.1 hypothetical protein [Tissierellia bacterium]